MENNPTPDLADKIATKILGLYQVGTYTGESVLYDPDFDDVDKSELAKLIREVINAG